MRFSAPVRAAVLVACVGMLVGVPAAVAAGTAEDTTGADTPAGVTWSLAPSGSGDAGTRVSLRHVLDPGSRVADEVTLTNFTDRAVAFAVYASDGVVTEGTFDVLAPGAAPIDGGSWITVGPVDGATARAGGGLVVEVAATSSVAVPVEIAVPAAATAGDHPAGVVAELVRSDDATVGLASRAGVRVHLRVSGAIVAALDPEVVRSTWSPSWNPFGAGTVRVEYRIVNKGNVRLGADVDTELAGPWGQAGTGRRTEEREVLPGQEAVAAVELPGWPLVRLGGTITVTPLVVGEDDVDAVLAPASARVTVWAVPWLQVALLTGLVGGVLLVRRRRRVTAARIQARIDAAVAEATSGAQPVPVAEPGDEGAGAGGDLAEPADGAEPSSR